MSALVSYEANESSGEEDVVHEQAKTQSEEDMLHLKVDSQSFQSLIKSRVGSAAPIVASKVCVTDSQMVFCTMYKWHVDLCGSVLFAKLYSQISRGLKAKPVL
jgi:hypothetical protein